MAGGMDVGALISNQMMAAAKVMEEQIDQEMEKLEKLDEDDLELLKVRNSQLNVADAVSSQISELFERLTLRLTNCRKI